MTNKEWMSTLPAEQFYNKMMCLIYDYGFRFNNARLAIINWLDEPHEAEPIQNKTSNALEQENEELTDTNVGKWIETKFSGFTYYKCSVCNANYECENAEFNLNFCPNCGADMRGREICES